MFERDGMLYAVTEFSPPREGEEVVHRAGALPHRRRRDADRRGLLRRGHVEKVIDEVAATRITERGATRGDDKVSEAAMEDRKREGYF